MPGRSINRCRCAKPPRLAKSTRTPPSSGAIVFSKAQNQSKDQSLAGIAEVDEIFLLESFKGQRKLPRSARKRGGVAEKPGLSAEQIPALIARNRAGAHIDAVLPDRSEALSGRFLRQANKDDTPLCMDGDKALIAFAEAEGIEYELIIASKAACAREGAAHPERQCLWRALQAMAQPLQRRRHQISANLPRCGDAGKGDDIITPQTALAAALVETYANSDSAMQIDVGWRVTAFRAGSAVVTFIYSSRLTMMCMRAENFGG